MDFDFRALALRIPPLLFALTIHEFAHAWSAYLCGDPTAKNQGRLTLDPLAHLDPIGSIMMLLVGFGWAKPVPVQPAFFRHPRRDDILVSGAGVAANLLTALTVAMFLRATSGAAIWQGGIGAVIREMLIILLLFSLALMIFNLIPIPPLDGSHILRNLLSGSARRTYDSFLPYAPILLIVLLVSGGVRRILWPPVMFLMNLLLGT